MADGGNAEKGLSRAAAPAARGLMMVHERNVFAAEEARSWKRWAVIGWSLFGLAVFIGFPTAYFVGRQPAMLLGMTPAGQVLRLPPLNETYVSNTALLRFCADSITDVMTFGHHDYQRRLEGVRQRFTPAAFAKWTASFQKNIEPGLVEFRQLYVSTVAEGCHILEEGALENGTKWWKLEGRGPLTVTSGGRVQSYVSTYEIQLVRASPMDNPEMLQIYSWLETDRR